LSNLFKHTMYSHRRKICSVHRTMPPASPAFNNVDRSVHVCISDQLTAVALIFITDCAL